MSVDPSPTSAGRDPAWLTAMIADYQSAVATTFLLHGEVHDYVDQPDRDQPVREYLSGRLAGNFSVVCYSPDEGITFPGELSELSEIRAMAASTRARFEAVTGLGAPPLTEEERLYAQAAGADPAATDLPREPGRALPRLCEFLAGADGAADGSGKRAVVLVDRLDLIAPPCDKGTAQDARLALLGLLGRVGNDRALNRLGNWLILLTPSLEEVHADLRQASSGIQAIEVPPPDHAERLAYLERLIPTRRLTLDGITPDQFAGQMAGLGRRHIEDVALRAIASNGRVLTPELVEARKGELIANEYGEVLTVLKTDVTLDMIGGHDLARAQIARLLRAAKSSDPKLRARIPKGMLLVGPAGTGKTFLGQAVANALGWACVEFDPSRVNGQFVGQSERLLAKAMRGARLFAPCVLIIDEVDQRIKRVTAGGGGGDQAAANQFGKMLEFLGDPSTKGRILTIAMSNWGDRVDAALQRPGRLDWKIPILASELPSERLDILTRILARNGVTGLVEPAIEALERVAFESDGWTTAELQRLVELACEIVDFDGASLSEALAAAGQRLTPKTQDVRAMTLSALAICDDLALVPERWRPMVGKPAPVPEAPRRLPAGDGVRQANEDRAV